MDWVGWLDLFGTLVFAISGVTTAIDKKFDLVGTLVIGFVTAIGGGSIRDIMIGRQPIAWLLDRNYIIAILVGYLLAYIFRAKALEFNRSLFLFDTIGIGLFTILGIEISLQYNLLPEVSIILGVISACFGGVIRDTLIGEIPLIFRKNIYASACFAGGLIFYILNSITDFRTFNILVSMLLVMLIRYLSVKFDWSLQFGDN